jgi:YVTN family beta-propeller protein
MVMWFNTLGATADVWFAGDGTLVLQAFTTGQAPNDIVVLDDGTVAIVNSLSSTIQFMDPAVPGTVVSETPLPAGSNPYCACDGGGSLWVTGLLSGTVYSVDLGTHSLGDSITGLPSPSGIAWADGLIYVGCANWPVPGAHGTLVVDPVVGTVTDTVQTPENTHSLRYFPGTGMIHAYSTTYTGDGAVSVIDPATGSVEATVSSGGAPFPGACSGGVFYSGDGYSSDSVFRYDEAGGLEMLDAGCGIIGIAALGDTLFMTCTTLDMVLVVDAPSWTVLDTLQAGDGPLGVAIIPAR